MSNGFFGRMGKGLLGAAVIATLSLGLGGCNNAEKKQIEALTGERDSLKNDKATLEADLRPKDQQIASQQSKIDTLSTQVAQANQPQPQMDNGGGGGGGKSRAARGDGTVITIAGDVLFDSGSANIKAGAKKELDKVASQIKGKWSGHTVRVEGYTDSDKPKKTAGKYPTNEALSQARAESVEQYLISKGVSADSISAVGKGAAKPKATKAASRRVEIVILGN